MCRQNYCFFPTYTKKSAELCFFSSPPPLSPLFSLYFSTSIFSFCSRRSPEGRPKVNRRSTEGQPKIKRMSNAGESQVKRDHHVTILLLLYEARIRIIQETMKMNIFFGKNALFLFINNKYCKLYIKNLHMLNFLVPLSPKTKF